MIMSETKKTLIEEGTEFKGTLTSSCAIVVMGRVEGEMSGPSVEVTESGVLCGKAKVTELRSRGELAGEFDAQVVELSGKVRDKTLIRAQSLEVNLQRSGDGRIEMVFGECELAVGDAPDKARAVREAASGGAGARARGAAPVETTVSPTTEVAVLPVAAGGGEVTADADGANSARNGRRPGKRGDTERQESA
jgi:cytoskeletal protein CcmA (bactofilin family)